MTKKKSEEIDLLNDAIDLLETAIQDWPHGCENELILGILDRAEHQFLKKLRRIQNNERIKKPAKPSKKDAPIHDRHKAVTIE